jgi:TolB-like protein/Tfp pilus assembly protein PilF
MKLRFDGWVLDPESGDLERAGTRTRLQEQPVQVLRELIARAGSVVTREQLMALLWPKGVVDFDTGLNTVIWKLRSALGDTAETPRYIETLPRRGYRFIGVLDPYPEPGSVAATVADGEPAPRGVLHRRTGLLYGAIAAALLALGYFALEWLNRAKPSVPGVASIAVLPLANESGDASQQYFSDGLSEDLITALAQFPGLKVIGRTSAFQFRDSKEDSRSIGMKLGVAHLLEGSVRRSGDVVRISAELIDTVDGSTQWSERYDRPYKDLFSLQDEITRAVSQTLRVKLLPDAHAAAQSERPAGESLEAYNALLQGRFYLFRGTEADYRKAIQFSTQATELDPRYALAWSALSRAWAVIGAVYLEGAPAAEADAKAREAVDRALALSPDLAGAHIARGYLLQHIDFDWRAAETEFRHALALAPNDGEPKFYLARQLATFGKVEQAIELTRQALVTEPLQANWYRWLGSYLTGLNRLDEAELAIGRAIELLPDATFYHMVLTTIEIQRGNAPAALAAALKETAGRPQDVALALARQIGSDRNTADAALRTLIDKDADIAAYNIAEVYALRNNPKETFVWLDKAWSNRDPGIAFLLYDPFILRYKDDSRFAAFCGKVGLTVPGEAPRKST